MKEIQDQVRAFATRYTLLRAPEVHALDLMAEAGEVAKEILTASYYGQRASTFSPRLAEEIGDVLYAVIALACACEVDLERALTEALTKYEERLARRGDPGSEGTSWEETDRKAREQLTKKK